MGQQTFFRMTTDKQRQSAELANSFASAAGASCFIVGAGPSLAGVDVDALQNAPAPRFCINLAGTGLFRPQFWTAYDPTARFSRSTYLDPAVMKLLPARRALDLVPETTWKACDCPNVYFFQGDRDRGFDNFVSSQHTTVVDWNDSLVQAIDAAYQLGFRTLYLLGSDMRIEPPAELCALAKEYDLDMPAGASLHDVLQQWDRQGFGREERKGLTAEGVYHFEEAKSLETASATDFHYFRVAQFLRLSRRAMSLAGLKLISVTPHSRLNDFFPYRTLSEAIGEITQACGDPAAETTRGRYSQTDTRLPASAPTMRDFSPLHWPSGNGPSRRSASPAPRNRLSRAKQMQQSDVIVEEEA